MNLSEWSDTPRTIAERLAVEAVMSGDVWTEPITWNGAKREPFLSLQAEGWTKRQAVMRLSSGAVVTVHVWVHPPAQSFKPGMLRHPKVMTTRRG